LVYCKVKLEDMKQGMAQNIVQVHSALEQQLKFGQTEPKMYGIITMAICPLTSLQVFLKPNRTELFVNSCA